MKWVNSLIRGSSLTAYKPVLIVWCIFGGRIGWILCRIHGVGTEHHVYLINETVLYHCKMLAWSLFRVIWQFLVHFAKLYLIIIMKKYLMFGFFFLPLFIWFPVYLSLLLGTWKPISYIWGSFCGLLDTDTFLYYHSFLFRLSSTATSDVKVISYIGCGWSFYEHNIDTSKLGELHWSVARRRHTPLK